MPANRRNKPAGGLPGEVSRKAGSKLPSVPGQSIWFRLFGIDYRSLALFRVMLGISLATDLVTQIPVFWTLHMPGGAIDRQALEQRFTGSWYWSVFWLSDWPPYRVMLLAAVAAASLCLVLGWRTRIATIVAWIVITSLNYDAPPATSGGDILLGLLLFWSMFLPLGQRWSLDARRLPPPPATTFASVATAGVLLQMAMMYFFTGIAKLTPPWLDGTALELVFSNARITRPLGSLLAGAVVVPRALTWLTLAAELGLPFLMFSPWKTAAFRSVALVVFMGMHLCIELTVNVLIFSLVSLAGLICFVPSRWWTCFPLNRLAALCDRLLPAPEQSGSGSRSTRAAIPSSAKFPVMRRFGQALLVVPIVYCLAENLSSNFAAPQTRAQLEWCDRLGELLTLGQTWNMFFDPRNLYYDVALVGKKNDDTYVDLLRPGVTVVDPTLCPARPAEYPSARMKAFLIYLANDGYGAFRRSYVEQAFRHWNANAAPQDKLVNLFLVYYPVPPHEGSRDTRYYVAWRARE